MNAKRSLFSLFVFVSLLTAAIFAVPTSVALAADPTPCPNGDCGGNWDRICSFNGDNFSRHDKLGAEFIVGDPEHSTVYELSFESSDGAFSDGMSRAVVVITKGQMKYMNGFTLNGTCYFGTQKNVEAYLSSGQAGHVKGLQYCTELTEEYIPVYSVNAVTGDVTVLVPGSKGPSVDEIKHHLVPLTQPTQPAAPTATLLPTQLAPTSEPPTAQPTQVPAQPATDVPANTQVPPSTAGPDMQATIVALQTQVAAAPVVATSTSTPSSNPGGLIGFDTWTRLAALVSWPVLCLGGLILLFIIGGLILFLLRRNIAPVAPPAAPAARPAPAAPAAPAAARPAPVAPPAAPPARPPAP